MWICPTCGEPHQDQFKECWRCVGAEFDEHVTATASAPVPELPKPEPRLRSWTSILLRMTVGFGIGMLLGIAFYHRQGVSLAGAAALGAIVGTVVWFCVGVFFWVVYPYERTSDTYDAPEENA